MIKSIRTSDIYSYTSTIVALTSICEVFGAKPIERATPTGTYLYTSIVSDNPNYTSFEGIDTKIARVSFTIVCKEKLSVGENEEKVLMDVIQVLDDYFATEFCNKVDELGNIDIIEVYSDSRSNIIYNEKNRPLIVKDYLITYSSN